MIAKGVLLAGGHNTRLHPVTKGMSKTMIPVYDKPMVYYPLSSMMLAGIREVLLITNEETMPALRRLIGDGSAWGMEFRYAMQSHPNGIAEALVIAEDEGFIEGEPCALMLADNILYGRGIAEVMRDAAADPGGATVLAYEVNDPSAFGVVELDTEGRPVSLEEKPANPNSNLAVIGCYFYDGKAAGIARGVKPSARGEIEISSVNRAYLDAGELNVRQLGRGVAWFDAGTADSLADATNLVRLIQSQQRQLIACPEEIAHANGWIDCDALLALAQGMGENSYSEHLRGLARPG